MTWRCPGRKRPPSAPKFNYQLPPLALHRLFAVSRSQEVVPLGLRALVFPSAKWAHPFQAGVMLNQRFITGSWHTGVQYLLWEGKLLLSRATLILYGTEHLSGKLSPLLIIRQIVE